MILFRTKKICHNKRKVKPDPREKYIAPIVEAYIPDGTHEEKLALTASFWDLFDALTRHSLPAMSVNSSNKKI